MTRDHFQECENAIQRDLDEISLMLEFIGSSFKVYSKSGSILKLVAQDPELRELLVGFRQRDLSEPTLLYQTLYVQVWSAFEGFVRKMVSAYLDTFLASKSDFDSLEKYGLGRRNLEYTGRALQFIRQTRPRFAFDFFTLARNVSTSTPGSSKVILNSDVFSLLLSGPSAEGLKDALERIGLELNWDDLGRMDSVQKSLRSKGTRETAKQVESFLREAARRRNSIVHKADTSEVISAAGLSEGISIFRALAIGLLAILRADCDSKTAVSSA
jgi:hypothetical protein